MHPVRKALVQPVLLGGMERVPLVIVLFVAGVFVLFQSALSIIVGLLIAAAGVIALRRTAEHDPQYFHVLYRRLKFGSVYGAVPLDAEDSDWWEV